MPSTHFLNPVPDLRVHRMHQVSGGHVSEGGIVHQAHKNFFVAVYALHEQVLKLLGKHRFKVFQAVGLNCLLNLLVGYGCFV